jgi:hypothetical protein
MTKRPASVGGPGVKHLGDVWMIHQCERLPLSLEPGDDLPAIHAEFDDLDGDAPFHWLALVSHPDFAKTTLADLFEPLVAANHL